MSTAMQTFVKNAKSQQMYPFVIGFGTVFLVSMKLFRCKEEDYVNNTANKRFAKSFIKKGTVMPAEEGGH